MLNWLTPQTTDFIASHSRPDLSANDGTDPSLAWLPTALQNAGMGSLLSHGAGLTLLAPSEAALHRWLANRGRSQADWLTDAEFVRRLLLDHLLPRPIDEAQLLRAQALSSLGRVPLRVEATMQGPMLVDGQQRRARLLRGDLRLGALRVHLIDRVLLAPQQSLLELLAHRSDFCDLTEALDRSGLACVLRSQGPFTLFAPSNDAFDGLAARLGLRRRALLADTGLLLDVLRYHLVSGRVAFADLPWGSQLPTAQGAPLRLSALGLIGSTDSEPLPVLPGRELHASNGVLHPLTQALMPPPR
ncbi:MAG: fasciclin domain-containing protein [Burkholderiaceae bacterium]|nr:fasciclin domain-containing protein [Burkholderiaceae bacterium]